MASFLAEAFFEGSTFFLGSTFFSTTLTFSTSFSAAGAGVSFLFDGFLATALAGAAAAGVGVEEEGAGVVEPIPTAFIMASTGSFC